MSRGLAYGPRFQAIRALYRGDGEALSELRLASSVPPATGDFKIHPILLDAALHTAAVFLPAAADSGAEVYLPVGFAAVRTVEPAATALSCHAILRQAGPERWIVDLQLFNPDGRLALAVDGLRVERVPAAEVAQPSAQPLAQPEDRLYRVEWIAAPPPVPAALPSATSPTSATSGVLLIGGGALAEALARDLSSRGVPVRRTAVFEPLSDPGTGRLEAVFLSALDAPPEAFEAAPEKGVLGALLHAFQAAADAADTARPVRFWVVTRGAQPVGPVTAPGQALLWGLARAFGQQEHRELWGGLIDLDPNTPIRSPDEARRIADHLLAAAGSGREDQIALRPAGSFVPRLRREAAPPGDGSVRLRADATYLITGGLGALGLRVARWMVDRGARRLVLLGRTSLPPRRTWSALAPAGRDGERVAAVRALEAAGASVHLAALDIADETADETAVGEWLTTFEAEAWPPIRGVVHAAGQLDDRLLLRLDAAGLAAVLRPKVTGAWVLHRAFASRPLDFFVLFSSLSAVLPPPGQANYAAANGFLDALAEYRRTLGLPGLSLGWGPWAEGGMAAHLSTQPTATGALAPVTPLPPDEALRLLGRALSGDAAHLVAAAIDGAGLRRLYPGGGPPPIFHDLLPALETAATGPIAPAAPIAIPAAEARPAVEERLRELAAAVLRLPVSRLDLRQPLRELGFDSIMAVELRAHLESSLGLTLPMRMLLDAPSVHQLAGRLTDHLGSLTDGRRAEP